MNKHIIWIASLLFVWIGMGTYSSHSLRSHIGEPNYGQRACIDLLFTGRDQKDQNKVYGFIREHFAHHEGNILIESNANRLPLFRIGYVKISHPPEILKIIEVEAAVTGAFPDLAVSITHAEPETTKQ